MPCLTTSRLLEFNLEITINKDIYKIAVEMADIAYGGLTMNRVASDDERTKYLADMFYAALEPFVDRIEELEKELKDD